ncbi:outer membrane protein assembly factor BamB family protein [Actinoplanes sp. HUAS TT8]|uniref:outer membrane protein assembly factor BamB family protein n=1 Tax=Actinoplanes sp. HUAS TT8 TaxID=3447453 RepID=UPI003F51D584
MRSVISAALSLTLIVVPPTSAPALWDHPGYDAERSYFNPHESAITATTVGHLHQMWTQNLRQADDTCAEFSAPILGGGILFAADLKGVSAHNPTTGVVLWRFDWDSVEDIGANGTMRMAVADDTLILSNSECEGFSGGKSRLLALDMAGHIRWQLPKVDAINSIVVDKGTVLISHVYIEGDATVLAYRVRDGKPLWSKPGYNAAEVSADGLVPLYKYDDDEETSYETAAVDITTGTARWSRPLDLRVQAASPASDRFYATDSSDALIALNAANGASLWSTPAGEYPGLAIDGPRVYVAVAHKISALAAATGRPVWSRTQPDWVSHPVVAAGLLYTGGAVLNAETGTPTAAAFPGKVIPAGGRLYQVNGPHLTAYQP